MRTRLRVRFNPLTDVAGSIRWFGWERLLQARTGRRLFQLDRKRADGDDAAGAIKPAAFGQGAVGRGLFACGLERQSGPAAAANGDRIPAGRRVAEAARELLALLDGDCGVPAGRKNSTTFMIVGIGTMKTSSTATIMHATPARLPQVSKALRTASSALVWLM